MTKIEIGDIVKFKKGKSPFKKEYEDNLYLLGLMAHPDYDEHELLDAASGSFIMAWVSASDFLLVKKGKRKDVLRAVYGSLRSKYEDEEDEEE